MESNIIFVPMVLAVIGLLFMFLKMSWVKKQPAGDGKMKSISKSIKEGALAFLGAEYRLLLVFVLIAYRYSPHVTFDFWVVIISCVARGSATKKRSAV